MRKSPLLCLKILRKLILYEKKRFFRHFRNSLISPLWSGLFFTITILSFFGFYTTYSGKLIYVFWAEFHEEHDGHIRFSIKIWKKSLFFDYKSKTSMFIFKSLRLFNENRYRQNFFCYLLLIVYKIQNRFFLENFFVKSSLSRSKTKIP